ncbi:MAG: MBL fold metallo-hydrolase [candidate division WOR-3 bacterium]
MKIKRISSFYSVFYLVELNGKKILIDSGSPFERRKINSLKEKLDFLLITHGHWDHIGNASFLQKNGTKIFIHERDYEFVKNKIIHLPPSKGTFYSNILYFSLNFLKRFAEFEIFERDILKDLNSIYIIETPGHTYGSVTFKIENNYFIGDTLIGPNPFLNKPRISLFVEDKKILKKTLEILFELEGRFYPGHGSTFTSFELKRAKDFIWRELRER